jgi:hypothetical protein
LNDTAGAAALITSADLSSRSRQDLADLARDSGISGYRGMTKDDLLTALRRKAGAKAKAAVAPTTVKPSKATAVAKATGASKKPVSVPSAKSVAKPKSKKLTGTPASKQPVSASSAVGAVPKTTKGKSTSTSGQKVSSVVTPRPVAGVKKVVAKGTPADPKTKTKAISASAAVASKAVVRNKSGSAQNANPGKVPVTSKSAINTNGSRSVESSPASRPAATRSVNSLTASKTAPSLDLGPETVSKKRSRGVSTDSQPLKTSVAAKAAVVSKASGVVAAPASLQKQSRSQPISPKAVEPKAVEPKAVEPKPSEPNRTKAVPTPETQAVKPRVGNRTFPASAKKAAPPVPTPAPPTVSAKSARIRREMALRSQRALQNKDISSDVLVAGSAVRSGNGPSLHAPHKDRVVLLVRDSYWLQADWEITRAAVERIRVAMAEKWHAALPVLRLMAVADANANRSEQIIRDIPIHGGISSWYIDVDEPPSRYRVVVGYVSDNDRFFPICRSNVIETPRPGSGNRIDEHWRDIAEDYERIYSLSGGFDSNGDDDLKEVFEERLKRTMPTRGDSFGVGSDTDAALDRHRALPFEVDAELIIYGSTIAGATVMLGGEPVKLRPDGSFTIRLALPDKRQVFPVVAQSRDGMRQRTTVVAVERNTKVMEAVDRDSNF